MAKHLVSDFMTAAPYVVQRGHLLAIAERMMREHGIRHLPVVEQSRLVGVLSEHNLLEGLSRHNAATLTVGELMSPDPLVVSPSDAVGPVAGEMARTKKEAAIVLVDGRVRGIFTSIDALRCLAELLPQP